MATKSKAYQAAAEKIEADRFYTPAEAVALAKETGSAKFDSTVEVALKLAVDPRKADQMVRGTVILPHGTGKTARVIVFATGPAAEAAIAAGADEVGGAELIQKVADGWTNFDAAVSTPEGASPATLAEPVPQKARQCPLRSHKRFEPENPVPSRLLQVIRLSRRPGTRSLGQDHGLRGPRPPRPTLPPGCPGGSLYVAPPAPSVVVSTRTPGPIVDDSATR